MWRCEDEKMWRWEDVKMTRWADVKMRRCEHVKMRKMRRCEDVRMRRWKDVKMSRCEDEKMWRWEGVKMWGCEDVKMRGWKCLTDPTIRRTLRSDALGNDGKCIMNEESIKTLGIRCTLASVHFRCRSWSYLHINTAAHGREPSRARSFLGCCVDVVQKEKNT